MAPERGERATDGRSDRDAAVVEAPEVGERIAGIGVGGAGGIEGERLADLPGSRPGGDRGRRVRLELEGADVADGRGRVATGRDARRPVLVGGGLVPR